MKIECNVNFDPAEIMKNHKIDADGAAWLFLGSTFKRLCDPYTPFSSGKLKSPIVVKIPYGATLKYMQPYAHYQYYGKTMGRNVLTKDGWISIDKPKHYTGGSLTYGNGALRGAKWDKRMMADRKDDLLSSFAAYVGGTKK